MSSSIAKCKSSHTNDSHRSKAFIREYGFWVKGQGHRVTKCKNILKAIEWLVWVCTSLECLSSSVSGEKIVCCQCLRQQYSDRDFNRLTSVPELVMWCCLRNITLCLFDLLAASGSLELGEIQEVRGCSSVSGWTLCPDRVYWGSASLLCAVTLKICYSLITVNSLSLLVFITLLCNDLA